MRFDIDLDCPVTCENFALGGETLPHRSGVAESLPKTVKTGHPDLELVRIASRGCGNQGRFVWRGKTPKGNEICRQGKVSKLTREGVSLEMARIAARTGYGMEMAKAAEGLKGAALSSPTSLALFAKRGRKAWIGRYGQDPAFSWPRWIAACEMADGWAKQEIVNGMVGE